MWTYYDNLKVARSAPPAVIKAAYRALSQQYHPDRNPAPDAGRIMRLINEAYDVLGDATRRAAYDREIEAEENEERLAAQRRAAAARKADESATARTPVTSSQTTPRPRPAPPPPPVPPAASRSALPPMWARGVLCAVLFVTGVWFSWREASNTTASRDVPEVVNATSPWATPPQDHSPEIAAPASGTPVPSLTQLAIAPPFVPPALNPASIPAAANPTPAPVAVNPAPAQSPVRPAVQPLPMRAAPTTPPPTDPDAEFNAMARKQVPDLDRIIHDPDWKTYMQWHEGTTTIGQITRNAVAHRDLKILVKIFDTFRLAKKTAMDRGLSFSQLMEYEAQVIKTLPAYQAQ